MKRLITLSVFFLFALAVTAQDGTLSGRILDATTGQPLIGATLFEPDLKRGTASNFDGEFTLKLPKGTYRFVVSFVGYKRDTVEVQIAPAVRKELTIGLKADGISIDQVVISASQFEKNIAEETVSVNVLDEQLLENSNVRDLGEGVAKLPAFRSLMSKSAFAAGALTATE